MITDFLTATTNQDLLPMISNLSQIPSPTIAQLLTRMDRVTGEAGDGTRIQVEVSYPDGRWYSGWDPGERTTDSPHRAFFEVWYNGQWDIALAGTDLESNVGRTTGQILRAALMADLNLPANKEVAFVNILEEAIRRGAGAGKRDISRISWGKTLPTDNANRLPATFDDLFDETASYHGIAPGGLGTFDAEDPWGTPADHLWENSTANIWEPRIYNSTGGADFITRSLIDEPLTEMEARWPGRRMAPLHPRLFAALKRDFEDELRFTVQMTFEGRVIVNITGIEYNNCFIFPDVWATTDEMRIFHIGDMEGPPEVSGATFFLRFWIADELADIESFELEAEVTIPFYAQEFGRSSEHADAIASTVNVKMAPVCINRSAQAVIRNLTAVPA